MTGLAIAATGGDVVRFTATVPPDAPYGAKHVLDLSNVVVNGGAAAGDNDGLHVVGYLGDTSGDATLSILDVTRLQRVNTRLDTGFAAYAMVDPVIIGDTSGNGALTSLDATRLLAELGGFDRLEIPPLPAVTPTINFAGPDPALQIGSVAARAGALVSVPLTIDTAAGLESARFSVVYDPAVLTLTGAATTPLTDGFLLQVDASEPGRIDIDMATTRPLAGGAGSLLKLDFTVTATASPQVTSLDLVSARLNDGALVLTPTPQPGRDGTDGSVRVLAAGDGIHLRGSIVESLRAAFEKGRTGLDRPDTAWLREIQFNPGDDSLTVKSKSARR